MKEKTFEFMMVGFGLILTLQLYTMTQLNDIDKRIDRIEGMNSVKECYFTRPSSISNSKENQPETL